MEPKFELDLMPLTSLALILLLILMLLSSGLSKSSLEVILPESESTAERKDSRIEITYASNGSLELAGKITRPSDLKDALKKALLANEEGIVLIRADKYSVYSDIEYIIKCAKESGAKEIAIATKDSE